MKQLTKLQKKIELTRALKKTVKNDIEPFLIKNLEQIIDDQKLPGEFFEKGNTSILEILLNDRLKAVVKNCIKKIQL